MADYDKNIVQVETLARALTRVDSVIDALDNKKVEKIVCADNKLKFYYGADTTGEPDETVDLPEEIFLDQLQTKIYQPFTFSAAAFPGATDPDLDGKPVFVFAVKGDKETDPTLTYSFVNLEGLIKTYTAADKAINIAGTSIGLNISADAGNILSIANDGLKAEMKVASATQGNFAIFGASGAVVDSGFTVATNAQIDAMLDEIFGTAD